MTIQQITAADEPVLWRFLAIAAHEPVANGTDFVRGHAVMSRYVEGFGREDDLGFFVFQNQSPIEPAGAIWSRIFPKHEAGYGFIGDKIPELAMAVEPAFQGQGLGALLLRHFLVVTQARYEAVSLNVRDENLAAISLYGRAGFKRVKGSEIKNRAGGVSFNMILRFAG